MECSTRLITQPAEFFVTCRLPVHTTDVRPAEGQVPLGEKSLSSEEDHVDIVHVQQ